MVADLCSNEQVGIVTYASRQTRVGRGLQRRALGYLETQYGYRSDNEWIDALNEAVAKRLARYDAKELSDFARNPELYRNVVLDSLVFGFRRHR